MTSYILAFAVDNLVCLNDLTLMSWFNPSSLSLCSVLVCARCVLAELLIIGGFVLRVFVKF